MTLLADTRRPSADRLFGTSSGSAAYNPALDYDGNGTVNTLDYAQFKKRFGMTFSL